MHAARLRPAAYRRAAALAKGEAPKAMRGIRGTAYLIDAVPEGWAVEIPALSDEPEQGHIDGGRTLGGGGPHHAMLPPSVCACPPRALWAKSTTPLMRTTTSMAQAMNEARIAGRL